VAVIDAKAVLVRVRVDHVFQGHAVKENEMLEIAVGAYRKPGKNPFEGEPLDIRDRLFWFVSPEPPANQPAGQPVIWIPMAGGAKLIYKDHVAEFSQRMNPGPPIAETDRNPPEDGKQSTLSEFRQQILQTWRRSGISRTA
jgi:hypothetical protein